MAGTTEAEQTADYIQLLAIINPIIVTRPYVSYLAGNAGLTTSLADLTSKINDGTATRNDYIDVLNDVGSVGLGLVAMTNLLGLTTVGLPILIGIGVGLAVLDYADEHNYDIDEIMDDLSSKAEALGEILGEVILEGGVGLGQLGDSLGEALADLLAQLPDAFNPQDILGGILDGLQLALPGGLIPWLLDLFPYELDPDIYQPFLDALGWHRPVDPLILDLDGDGIETIGISTTSHVMFDGDGDGVKTATGWIKGDDGLLVFDRNGNGTIDNGGELFGDQAMVNGTKAKDGFSALSSEDTNKDGKFDANDTNFANVRVWRDMDSDALLLVA